LCSSAWATGITLGQTESGTIASAAQSDRYTFSANANDLLEVTMYAYGYAPTVQLIGTDGTVLGSASGGNCDQFNNAAEMGPIKLTITGTYTLLASACNGQSTGGYAIYVQRTNNPLGAASASFGLTEAGTIALAAQSNTYTFNASAKDVLDFTMAANGYAPNVTGVPPALPGWQ
jgi:hypothetical protein